MALMQISDAPNLLSHNRRSIMCPKDQVFFNLLSFEQLWHTIESARPEEMRCVRKQERTFQLELLPGASHNGNARQTYYHVDNNFVAITTQGTCPSGLERKLTVPENSFSMMIMLAPIPSSCEMNWRIPSYQPACLMLTPGDYTMHMPVAGDVCTVMLNLHRTAMVDLLGSDSPVNNLERLGGRSPLFTDLNPRIRAAAKGLLSLDIFESLRFAYATAKIREIAVLAADQLLSAANRNKKEDCLADNRLTKVRGYLEQTYMTPPSVEDLAQLAGINRTTLVYSFKEMFGCTPHEYCRKLRMERAFELLKARKGNIRDIAFEVGYEEQSSFTRAFLRHFGMTPRQAK